MFPLRRVSKRVADEADRARMLRLCDELRAEALPAPTILRDAGLRVVRFDSLTDFAAMRSTMAKVDH